jgi:O-antigen ligase
VEHTLRPLRRAAASYPLVGLAIGAAIFVGSAATAYLVAGGMWYIGVGLMLGVPFVLLLHRYPLAGVMIWLLMMPFLVDGTGGGLRKLFWLVHRSLPVLVLVIVVVATRLGLRDRRLPRLGWPEVIMGVYLVVSLLSIGYLSQVDRPLFTLYDAVFIPMVLYLIVRLTEPDERDLRRFVPILAFILMTQAMIGSLSWVAPGLLPGEWLDRIGTRTTGSVRSVSVFGTTMIFAGALFLHTAWYTRRTSPMRIVYFAGAAVAALMIFMTFSRASWIAGIVVFAGLAIIYRGLLRKVLLLVVPVALLLVAFGLANGEFDYASQRFLSSGSEQSALGRLPVAVASVKMFEERPVWGFGYGNFDLFDRQYQEAIPGLVVPEKDHSSHNLYLTLLAEQGLIGLLAYAGAAVWWLSKARPAARRLPRNGVLSRQLLFVLWLGLLSHVIVNNFSNMKVTFGLGTWWLVLGFIAVLTTNALRPAEAETPHLETTSPPLQTP